jgi:hypothetical protein
MNEYTQLAKKWETAPDENAPTELLNAGNAMADALRRIGEAMEAGALTDERIKKINENLVVIRLYPSQFDFARAIEAEVAAPLLARIAELETQLAATRDTALDEAAALCDQKSRELDNGTNKCWRQGV